MLLGGVPEFTELGWVSHGLYVFVKELGMPMVLVESVAGRAVRHEARKDCAAFVRYRQIDLVLLGLFLLVLLHQLLKRQRWEEACPVDKLV